MDAELQAMNKNQVWTLVERPQDKNFIDSKWIFKIKSNGTPKARLVARGYQQNYENEEIYAPVAKASTIKMLFAIVNDLNLEMEQLDVKTAFLNGTLTEEVYIEPPKGQEQVVYGTKVCKLQKSIYGLRISPRRWYQCLDEFLKQQNFQQSENDPCLYVKTCNNVTLFILIYVDDIIIASNVPAELTLVKDALKDRFDMVDLGVVTHFLGIEVTRDRTANLLQLSQTKYIEQLVQLFGLEETALSKTPIETNLTLLPTDDNTTDNPIPYRELIGALLFIAGCTRPDIAFAANFLSHFQHVYGKTHYKHAIRVLKYLNGTKHYKLKYRRQRNNIPLEIFTDADWATDKTDRKSTTGVLVF